MRSQTMNKKKQQNQKTHHAKCYCNCLCMHMRCNQNLSTFHSHTHHHHHSMVAISDKNSNTNQTRDIGQCYKYLVEFWFFNFFSNKMCNTNAATFIAALPMVKIPSNTCKAHSHGSNTRPKKMPTVFSYVSHYIHARTRIRLFNNDAIKKKMCSTGHLCSSFVRLPLHMDGKDDLCDQNCLAFLCYACSYWSFDGWHGNTH